MDWLGSIGQKQAWWFLHISLLPGQIHLAKTWHSEPEPNRIQAGFAHCDLWKIATESENGKQVAGQLHSARTRPDDSHTPACLWTRCIWLKPDQTIQIRSSFAQYRYILDPTFHIWFGSVLPKKAQIILCKTGSGCMLAIMAITGHNQNTSKSDPACLLGTSWTLPLISFLLHDPLLPDWTTSSSFNIFQPEQMFSNLASSSWSSHSGAPHQHQQQKPPFCHCSRGCSTNFLSNIA